MNKVEAFLQHYQYDPVKAHEYYMRTRQLKGRTTRKMSDKQKEAWAYVNDQIKTDKRATIDAEIERRKQNMEAIRKRISEKLKLLNERLSKKTDKEERAIEREKIRGELKTAISSAWEAYKKARTDIDSAYESKSQAEYDKILKTVPGKKIKRRRR